MKDDDIVIEEEGESGAKPEQKLKKLRDELAAAKKERDENLAGWQRAKADYVNLERRMRELREAVETATTERVALGIVQALDSLEAAMKSYAGSPETLSGLSAVMRQAEEALKECGITRYLPKEGDAFDPHLHEPVQTLATEVEKDDNTISEALQSGYRTAERTIRPARVVVFRFEA